MSYYLSGYAGGGSGQTTLVGARTFEVEDSTNNAQSTIVTLRHITTGTPAAGIGARLLFQAEDSGSNNQNTIALDGILTTVTDGSEESAFDIYVMSAGTLTRVWRNTSSTATLTGTFLTSDGSDAAPAYSFTNDANTGIFRSANDTLDFSTGGTSRVTLTTSALTTTVSTGIGGAPTTSTILTLTSTTGALLLPRMTTAQRDLLTAANGMQIYNSTTNVFNFYENGAWTTISSAAGLVLVAQQTASNSASLAFTTAITATYDEYLIELINIVPANNTIVQIELSTDGGSSYDTAANYDIVFGFAYPTAEGVGAAAGTTALRLREVNTTLATNGSYSASIRMFNPAGAKLKQFTGQVLMNDSTLGALTLHWAGVYNVTTAVNAFRVICASGNITSGTVRVYGLSK